MSNSNTEGQGDNVLTNATAHVVKNSDGTVALNISSSGNAIGADFSAIQNQAVGQIGSSSILATGNVESKGQNTSSASDVAAAAQDNNRSVSSMQKGEATGRGDTSVQANGGSVMSHYGMQSPYSGHSAMASAGATGSLASLAKALSKQELTWENILVHVIGSAAAEGIGNAQANLDIGAGNAYDGVGVSGLVSGVNTANGHINTEVNGSANMNGGQHDLAGNMYGNVEGVSGNSTLVGATNIQSSSITRNSSVSSFADSKVHTDGISSINLSADTGFNTDRKAWDLIFILSLVLFQVQNSLRSLVAAKTTALLVAIGNGVVYGEGTENSNASLAVDTKYRNDGTAQIVVNGDGQAISNGTNSSLSIGANADISNTYAGSALSNGVAHGEVNGMSGNVLLDIDGGSGTGGNAKMEAWGGGNGDSQVLTNAGLILKQWNELRNISVNGGVSANGDQTKVNSFSMVKDNNGEQTLENSQKASSSSKGSSSASASSYIVLKR
ncbi:hypothetical protein NECAME_03093 [Necator americanus]|uniref:Uncharacterized protein n=1 Tax=Necator americanus TaxID=51031 RepID=W2T6N6_NECAM|nr:hypothetical protein NECAME_03093 [Necator americanus]ETN77675.1 hypothetical protein NECAME_03093 [Necator americanus]